MSFQIELDNICNRVAFASHMQTPKMQHCAFMLEAAKEQIKVHDPKSKSFSVVMQLVETAFKG